MMPEDSQNLRERLLLAYQERSAVAANYLRTLLFTLAGAAAGFVASRTLASGFLLDYVAVFLFGIALAVLVYSWDLQKGKSIDRVKKLRQSLIDFDKYQDEIDSKWYRCNYIVDRLAAMSIGLGFIAEFIAIACRANS